MWRQADGSDGLYEECIGPSAYWKAQGTPVRIWGLLVAGVLFIYVMPGGETMNRWWYLLQVGHPPQVPRVYGTPIKHMTKCK